MLTSAVIPSCKHIRSDELCNATPTCTWCDALSYCDTFGVASLYQCSCMALSIAECTSREVLGQCSWCSVAMTCIDRSWFCPPCDQIRRTNGDKWAIMNGMNGLCISMNGMCQVCQTPQSRAVSNWYCTNASSTCYPSCVAASSDKVMCETLGTFMGCQWCSTIQGDFCSNAMGCSCVTLESEIDCEDANGACRWDDGLCLAGTCFNYISRGYTSQPYALLIVSVGTRLLQQVGTGLFSIRIARAATKLKFSIITMVSTIVAFLSWKFRFGESLRSADFEKEVLEERKTLRREKDLLCVYRDLPATTRNLQDLVMHHCGRKSLPTSLELGQLLYCLEKQNLWVDDEIIRHDQTSNEKRETGNFAKDTEASSSSPMSFEGLLESLPRLATHDAIFLQSTDFATRIDCAIRSPGVMILHYYHVLQSLVLFFLSLKRIAGNADELTQWQRFELIGFRLVNSGATASLVTLSYAYYCSSEAYFSARSHDAIPLFDASLILHWHERTAFHCVMAIQWLVVGPFLVLCFVGTVDYIFVIAAVIVALVVLVRFLLYVTDVVISRRPSEGRVAAAAVIRFVLLVALPEAALIATIQGTYNYAILSQQVTQNYWSFFNVLTVDWRSRSFHCFRHSIAMTLSHADSFAQMLSSFF